MRNLALILILVDGVMKIMQNVVSLCAMRINQLRHLSTHLDNSIIKIKANVINSIKSEEGIPAKLTARGLPVGGGGVNRMSDVDIVHAGRN